MSNLNNLLKNLLLFHPYLKKFIVKEKLSYLNKFPNFNTVYSSINKENNNDDTSEKVAKTLIYGIENNIIDEIDLDEILFLILEDSLLNSYLYKLNTDTFKNNNDVKNSILSSWNVPEEKSILKNININTKNDFVICGYRSHSDGDKLESLRILLLDKESIDIHIKNEGNKQIIFPTIIEIDLIREILHIRLRDVDNIVGQPPKISTMSGRVDNTLNFIRRLKPTITFDNFNNFKSSLYLLEEHLLAEKRDIAYRKLEEFEHALNEFTQKVTEKFNPPSSHEITPIEYIKTGVLSVVATTLDSNELGDVVGIRFRNSNNDNKYAEITIKDNGHVCISTSNLYWLNLSVLQNTKSIEFLKMIPQLENGVAVVNLEHSLDTANIRLLQRKNYDGEGGAKPNQEKYDDVINFIKPFLNPNK